jgi:hypothetical protein
MRRPDRLVGEHLAPDRVAACQAGQGTLPELAHLRRCAGCQGEVEAVGRVMGLTEAWRATPAAQLGAPPLVPWEALAPRLRAEGLLREPVRASVREPVREPVVAPVRGAGRRGAPGTAPRTPRWLARGMALLAGVAAAAVLLLRVGGAGVGGRVGGGGVAGVAAAIPVAPEARRMVAADLGDGAVVPWAGDPAVFGGDAELADPQARSLSRTRARVAALDQLLAASQAALASAPGDPVLQRSVESAHAAREAALRALGGTLPASHQLVRY